MVPHVSRRVVLAIAGVVAVGVAALAAVLLTRSSPAQAGLLAFASMRHGNGDIYTMRSDGSGERRLTRDAAEDWFPVWSPDGKRIAFTRIRGGFSCDPDTDLLAAVQMVRIPFVDLVLGCMPKRLASAELYVMNADGSGQRRLAAGLGAAWAPDGQRIAFLRLLPKQNSDIYMIGIDGSGRHRLTHTRSREDLPTWSPNGQRLAFDSERDSSDAIEHTLYVVNDDGSGLRPVTPGRYGQEGSTEPAWSPDGTKIALSNSDGAISTISPQGENPQALRTKKRDLSSESDGYPAWSPDGHKLAFIVLDSDNGRRYLDVVDADGNGLHQFPLRVVPVEKPTWSPDSRSIALTAMVGGRALVTIFAANDGSHRALEGPGSDHNAAWQPGGTR